jgi:hypothetical protein
MHIDVEWSSDDEVSSFSHYKVVEKGQLMLWIEQLGIVPILQSRVDVQTLLLYTTSLRYCNTES